MQALTSSCRATLAATVELGIPQGEEGGSEGGHKTQRDASPYPQLPTSYDTHYFHSRRGERGDDSSRAAQRRACAGSDVAAACTAQLIMLDTVP